MDCSTPGFPALHYLQSLLKLMPTELVMSLNHLILCRPLLLLKPLNKLGGKELPQSYKRHTRKLSQRHTQSGKSESYFP